jgi:F-type H+-transporting ATPase subunit alpha
MRQVAGRLKLELAGFRSLAAFAQFGADLDADTRAQLERGQRLTETLKQGQYNPLPVEEEVAVIWAATNGYLDDVAVENVRGFEADLLEYLRTSKADLLKTIADEKAISDATTAALQSALKDFKAGSRFTSAAAD